MSKINQPENSSSPSFPTPNIPTPTNYSPSLSLNAPFPFQTSIPQPSTHSKPQSKDLSNLLSHELLNLIDEDYDPFKPIEEDDLMLVDREECNIPNFNYQEEREAFNTSQMTKNTSNANSSSNLKYYMFYQQNSLPRIFSNPMNLQGTLNGMNLANSSFSMNGKSGWVCPYCKNFNYEIRTECNRCGKTQEMFYQSQVGNSQDSLLEIGKGVSKRKKHFIQREGDWICGKCNNFNFAFRKNCNRCRLEKSRCRKNSAI